MYIVSPIKYYTVAAHVSSSSSDDCNDVLVHDTAPKFHALEATQPDALRIMTG